MAFTPKNGLLDQLLADHSLKNDAALARKLQCAPPVLSKIRNGASGVSAAVILNIHEALNMPVKEIRALIKELP